jgi:twitching motility protein PilT
MADSNGLQDINDFWKKRGVSGAESTPSPTSRQPLTDEAEPSEPGTITPSFPGAQPRPSVQQRPGAPVLPNLNAGVRRNDRDEDEREVTLDHLLGKLLDMGGSDLHLKHGKPPMVRVRGEIRPMPGERALTGIEIDDIMRERMDEKQENRFEMELELDFAVELPGRSRFRVNVHRQRRHTGSVIRVIPNKIKNLKELGMPDVLRDFAKLPRGLVLVTGPTGSGKSTTLAAIVDEANDTRHDNIITIEDPIEFVHEDKNCIVVQREIGVDTSSFSEALRRALRQDPDIILVGEMRDAETIQTAITAAETGHLVFGTLHTQSASATMSRIIDTFPANQQAQIQAQLANSLQAIVCQALVPTLDGKGRIAALEILRNNNAIRSQIRKGLTEQISNNLVMGKEQGMQTLDMHLERLVAENKIGVDAALSKAADYSVLEGKFGGEAGVSRIRNRQNMLGGSLGQKPVEENFTLR